MTTADVLTGIGLLATFVSVVYAGRQLSESKKVSQSEFLFSLITWYLDDMELRRFFYRLDYNQWIFDEKTFCGSKDEPPLDKMLFFFDTLWHMLDTKRVRVEDIQSALSFEISRVLHNPEVEKYLTWLDEDYRRVGRPGPAYAGARRLSEDMRTAGIADGTATTFTSDISRGLVAQSRDANAGGVYEI